MQNIEAHGSDQTISYMPDHELLATILVTHASFEHETLMYLPLVHKLSINCRSYNDNKEGGHLSLVYRLLFLGCYGDNKEEEYNLS